MAIVFKNVAAISWNNDSQEDGNGGQADGNGVTVVRKMVTG